MVSTIIEGRFNLKEWNHNKPVYEKLTGSSVNVLIYFWDERDEPSFAGWRGPGLGVQQIKVADASSHRLEGAVGRL